MTAARFSRVAFNPVRVGVLLLLACGVTLLDAQPTRPYPSSRRPLEMNAYVAPAPGATPWAPAWSPDGRWIAVGMHGSIWRIDHASGAAEELTTGGKYHAGAPFIRRARSRSVCHLAPSA
jgi:hypothetical protein